MTTVVGRLTRRSFVGMLRMPAAIIPVVAMPMFFTVAFSGAFSGLTLLPGFPTTNILSWMLPFAILQGAAFAGFGSALGVGRDLENGFFDRLLLAPTPRLNLVLGSLSYSALRAMLPVVTVLPLGLVSGASLEAGWLGLVTLVVGALGVALMAGLWGLGVTYRMKTQRSGALIQVGILMTLFLSIGQVPLEAMNGWLRWVAERNPFTYILQMARQGFLGPVTWSKTWPGLVAIGFGAAILGAFCRRGFRRVVP